MICIPAKPATKKPNSNQAAFDGATPPFSKYFFDDGNMLNKAENICSRSATIQAGDEESWHNIPSLQNLDSLSRPGRRGCPVS